MAIQDGMEDIGNLPQRTVAVRNKTTGEVMTRESLARGPVSPDQEDPWVPVVRFAYRHQDSMELLSYDPRLQKPGDLVKDRDEPGVPTMEDGRPMTFEVLDNTHWQTLRKLCKQYNGNPDGKTKLQVIEQILQNAYTQANLPIPVMPAV